MLSDVANYAIGIASIMLSRKAATAKMTFGFNRYEVLGALLSVFIIWILTAFLVLEAVDRFFEPTPVDGFFMLIVAVLGLVANIVMGIILVQSDEVEEEPAPVDSFSDNRSHTLWYNPDEKKETKRVVNIRAALMNVIGDAIQSVGVIIASLVVYIMPEWMIADPICTILFAILVLFTTVPIFRDCVEILLESTPKELDVYEIIKDIEAIPDAEDIHSVHAWAISSEKTCFSCHLRSKNPILVTAQVTRMVKSKYGIKYPTI
jgi:cation diffusion facilitator family transporter